VMFVKESHAVALFPGGFGTHDEGFEALTLLQTGKAQLMPVVFVDAPGGTYWKEWLAWVDAGLRGHGLIDADDLRLFSVTDDVDAAVAEIVRFYANYHSSRFVGDRLVIRLRHAPDSATLARLNAEFDDLLEGAMTLSEALAEEAAEHPGLPRLVLDYDRRRSGRLRMLVDRLNELAPAPAPPLAAGPQQVIAGRLTAEEQRAEDEV
jgi:Possible lysine decarboxylase